MLFAVNKSFTAKSATLRSTLASRPGPFSFPSPCGILSYASTLARTDARMKMILASILTTILIVAMTLAAMFTLVRATVYVTSIPSPLQRAVAICAELFLGVVLLLGTVWLATHLAVRIFSTAKLPSSGGPLA